MLRHIICFIAMLGSSYSLYAGEIHAVSSKGFYISDGDSVSIRTRIYAIDTPELGQSCTHNAKQLDCGKLAKEHLRLLLKQSDTWEIQSIAVDNYGRLLVSIESQDLNIAEQMVSDGMAYAYNTQYKTEERNAKRLKKGFWAYDTPPIPPRIWRKKHMKR